MSLALSISLMTPTATLAIAPDAGINHKVKTAPKAPVHHKDKKQAAAAKKAALKREANRKAAAAKAAKAKKAKPAPKKVTPSAKKAVQVPKKVAPAPKPAPKKVTPPAKKAVQAPKKVAPAPKPAPKKVNLQKEADQKRAAAARATSEKAAAEKAAAAKAAAAKKKVSPEERLNKFNEDLKSSFNLSDADFTGIDLNKEQFGLSKNLTALNAVIEFDFSGTAKDKIPLLIAKGANPNLPDRQGYLFIHNIALKKNLGTLQALLSRKDAYGINLLAKNSNGHNVIDLLNFDLYGTPSDKQKCLNYLMSFPETAPLIRAHTLKKNVEEISDAIRGSKFYAIKDRDYSEVDLNRAHFMYGLTALNLVIREQDTSIPETIALFVSKGANPKAYDDKGDQPIHNAARVASLPALKALCALTGGNEVDLTAKNVQGKTIVDILDALPSDYLHDRTFQQKYTIQSQECLDYLKSLGKLDPLFKARRDKRIASINNSLANPTNLDYISFYDIDLNAPVFGPGKNLPALHAAIDINVSGLTPAALRVLIEKGANPRTKDNNGDEIIHRAARLGSIETLRYLSTLGFRAPINAPNTSGETIYEIALKSSNSKLLNFVKAFPEFDSNEAKLLNAVLDNDIPAAQHQINLSVNLNQQYRLGHTALMCAIENGFDNMFDLLLSNGADPTIWKDGGYAQPENGKHFGRQAVHFTIGYPNLRMLDALYKIEKDGKKLVDLKMKVDWHENHGILFYDTLELAERALKRRTEETAKPGADLKLYKDIVELDKIITYLKSLPEFSGR